MEIISSMQEIFQVIFSLFDCVKKRNNVMISYIKDLREENNDLISVLKVDILTLEKKVDCLNVNVELDNIN